MADPLLSVNEYPTDGIETNFEINFTGGYISQEHVSVRYIDATGLATEPTFTWVGPFSISVIPAPAAGGKLRIYRTTPADLPLVNFSDGSVINEATLDLNAKQAVFLAAEVRDVVTTAPELDDVLAAGAIATAAADAAEASADTSEAAKDIAVAAASSAAGAVDALADSLESTTGAEIIGTAGGATLAERLDLLDALGVIRSPTGNAPSVVQFGDHNFLRSSASASAVLAGTVDQPNINGGKGYVTSFTGNGATTAFVVNPGFVVDDVPYRNILVYKVILATNSETLLTEVDDYTVSGKTTSSITINMLAAPSALEGLRVRVYKKEDSIGGNPLLNFVGYGYDNFNDGSGPMLLMFGAHQVNIGNAGGHNSFLGGANNLMQGSTSYSACTGLSNTITGSLAAFAAGMRGKLTGEGATHFGSSGKVGGWSVHFGQQGECETLYSAHFGRRGKTRIAGDRVISAGAAADASAGMMTIHEFPLRKLLVSASSSPMAAITGSSTFAVPVNGICHVYAEVTLQDTDSTDFRVIALRSTVQRDAGNVVTVVGSHSAAVDQQTVLDEPPGFAPTAGNWEVQLYGSSTGIFLIQARGAAGKNIQALGVVRVMHVDPAAS